MGDLILLPQRKRPPSIAAPHEPTTSAQILFYTGVRYQRMSDPEPNNGFHPSSTDGMGTKRKRKRG